MARATNNNAAAEERPGQRPSLLRNISWLGIANVLVKPFWFIFVTAACMRLLGVAEYGVMTAALSLGMIAAAFVDVGMTQYTVREVSRRPESASLYFSNFMTLRLANSLIAGAGAAVAAFILDYRGLALVSVGFAAAYALSLNLTNYCRGIYRAFEDLRREAAMLVVEKVLVVGAGLLLLVTTRAAAWTLAGMAAGMLMAMAANTWWIHRHIATFHPGLVSRPFLKSSFRAMLPFGLAGLFTVIYYRVDMIMVEAFLGDAATGQYGAAFRILEALNVLPAIVSVAAIYPRLARLYQSKTLDRFKRLLGKSSLGLAAASLVVATGLAVFASQVIHLLDPDPSYGPAVGALQILVWSFPFFCVNSIMYVALLAMNLQRFASIALGLAVILNVGLNLFMIPAFGINGAAVATVVPEVMLIGVYVTRYRYARDPLPRT